MSLIDWAEVLITGGTGSLGKTLTSLLLKEHKPKGIRIFSRCELRQSEMQSSLGNFQPVAFLLGDIRDRRRLLRAMEGVDIVIHTAAMKQVPACEYNPVEAVHTNVTGSINVLECAIDAGVKRVMYTNSDKSVLPVNLYGSTKMVAEKIFIHGNTYSPGRTQFAACRYGNVLASRGSVVHVWKEQAASDGKIKITHPEMTRFWVSLPAMARFILNRMETMNPGDIYVPYIPACSILTLANIVCPGVPHVVVGVRQGEKIHETLVTAEEMFRTKYHIAFSPHDMSHYVISREGGQARERDDCLFDEYRSDTSPYRVGEEELKRMLEDTV